MNDPSPLLALVAAIAVFTGSFLFLAGAIGLVRLPDFYSRMHASTKAASLGIPLVALASMLIHLGAGFDIWMEDALIILFVFLGNPVSAQILVWAAIKRKIPSSTQTQGQPVEEM
jgi:multicomponent K+:H+ antiporter subunit G